MKKTNPKINECSCDGQKSQCMQCIEKDKRIKYLETQNEFLERRYMWTLEALSKMADHKDWVNPDKVNHSGILRICK